MERINIYYWINNLFAKHCLTSIISLLENTKHVDKINLYILTEVLDEKNIRQIKIVCKWYWVNFKIVNVDLSEIKNIDVKPYNCSALIRLLVDKYISDKKCIYLDSDTIIIWDIIDLYNVDIWNAIVWVIKENNMWLDYHNIISLQKDYFNSWVMVINLDLRRKNLISSKVIKYLKNIWHSWYADQDALYMVLDKRWSKIPESRNVYPHHSDFKLSETNCIHYMWDKPWDPVSSSPSTIYYFDYLMMTGLFNDQDIILYSTKIFFYRRLTKFFPVIISRLIYICYNMFCYPRLSLKKIYRFIFWK